MTKSLRGWKRLAVLALLLGGGVARADGVRFEAHVQSENITIDQTVELTVVIDRDGNQVFESYRAPVAPDFDLLHTGTSQQMQMSLFNGRQSVRRIEEHQYIFKPKKKGALTISAATVKVGGQTLSTKPLVIHVGAPLKNALSGVQPQDVPQAQPAPAPDTLRGDEDLYIDARADKAKVYVGEQLTVTWRLYTQSDILKYRTVTEPKHEDFWSEDLFVPTGHLAWDRQLVKGQEYSVALLLKKALFPLKAGKLSITPLDAEATTLQSAFYPNASAVRRSPAINVEVLPLPAAGRPAGFEAPNVGQLELEAKVDRTQVKAGEAVTWRLTVRGTGNLRNVRLPRIEKLDGFKVYEPTTRENIEKADSVRGEKVYTYLLLPARGGTLTLPEVSLPYFDPQATRYAVAKTQPISVTVEGDPTKVETAAAQPTQENVLGQQVRPIRNRSTVRSQVGEVLWRGRAAWILLGAPPALWLLVLVGDALRVRLSRETARSKRRRARRTARRRLRVAEYHIKAQRPSAFFGECARVIYEHLEYCLGNKVEGLTLGELRPYLEVRGFPKETAEAVVQELESADFARFAPSASGPGEMRAALRRVRTLLGLIEKVKALPPVEKEFGGGDSRSSSIKIVINTLLFFLALLPAVAHAQQQEVTTSKDAVFRRGNDSYFHGKYKEAVEAYEQVAALGVRAPDLFYNLGNAYLKSGQLGPAIYNYERALELDPSAEDVAFNLKAARTAARDKGEDKLVGAENAPMWQRIVQPYTVATLGWIFLALYTLVFALLIALHFVPPGFLRVGLWAGFAFVALATGGSAAMLGGRVYLAERVEQAIVLPDSAQVKEGPDPNYQALFSVHAGLRVRITEREQDWVRVRLANGLEGWLRESELGRL